MSGEAGLARWPARVPEPAAIARRFPAAGRGPVEVALAALPGGLALLLAAPAMAQAAPPSSPTAAPSASATPPGEPPAEPGSQSESRAPGEVQPAGPEPVGPVRSFEPVPIPEGMAPPGVRTTPYEPGSLPPPPRPGPPPVDARAGARLAPGLPGAADAGFVVVDPQRVFGADALPAFGANVVQAVGFTLAAQVEARYDDNFPRIDGPLPPGSLITSKEEITVTPTATVGFGRQVDRQFFFFTSSVGRNIRLRNDGFDADRVTIDGGWDWRAGSACSGRISGGWFSGETRVADQIVRANLINKSTNLFTSATCNLPSGLIPSVSAYVGTGSFTGAGATVGVDNLADSDFWGVTPSLGYAFSARGQAGVQFSYQNARFPNQLLDPDLFPPGAAPPPGTVNGVDSIGVSGFVTYRFTRRMAANAAFGFTRTRSQNPLVDEFSGWTGNLGLNYADRRWGGSLNFGRGVSLGRDNLANFVVETNVNLAGSYRLRPRVTLLGGFDYSDISRRGVIGTIGGAANFDDRTQRYFTGTDLRLTERIILNVSYFHEVRDFEFFGIKANSDQVASTLRFVFR